MRATDPLHVLIRLIRSHIRTERKTRFQIERLTFRRHFYPAFPPLRIASWHEHRLTTPPRSPAAGAIMRVVFQTKIRLDTPWTA
jgi:hypothetical protein